MFFWIGIPIIYGLNIITWSRPNVFTGIYFGWFFNPHIGYIDNVDQEYENTFHTVHNISVIIILTITYLAFCIIFVLKSKQGGQHSNQQSYSELMIFIQIFLISLSNILGASIYVYMQYIDSDEVLIILGQFFWLNAHGQKYFYIIYIV
ncbi:unnamed protein product [Meloidogyne enterolobii]